MNGLYLKKHYLYFKWSLFALIFTATFLSAQPAKSFERVMIKPSKVELEIGKKQQFTVVYKTGRHNPSSINYEVKWSVNRIPGGNNELGTIDNNGLYRTPNNIPSPAEVQICAEVKKAANSRLWATVLFKEKKPQYKVLWKWSEAIEKPKYFQEPHSITLDKDGNILIADMGASRIIRFTPRGEFLAEIGKGYGNEKGHFNKPRDVAIDSKGYIFVSDQKSNKPRIQVFNPNGDFLRDFADEGSGPGQIIRPHGLAFINNESLLVIDVDNIRANLYEHSGKFVRSLGQNGPNTGKLITPHGIAVDSNNDVFISDYFGTVQKFTIDGDYLFSFVNENHTTGSAFIHSICSDRWGNVYLMVRGIKGFEGTFEESKERTFYIVKYNNSGDFICTIQLSDKGNEVIHAVVDQQGTIYALFKGMKEMGVEVLGEN